MNTQQDAADGQPSSETLEVIYDHLKDVPEVQQTDAKDLDTKMVQILQAQLITRDSLIRADVPRYQDERAV